MLTRSVLNTFIKSNATTLQFGKNKNLLKLNGNAKRNFSSYSSSSFKSKKRSTPMNLGIVFVPQQESWIVERFGKYSKVLNPGLNVLVPIADRIAYRQSLKIETMEILNQAAITKDAVHAEIDAVLYYQVQDSYKASYSIDNHEFAIHQIALSTMRAELGKMTVDQVIQERQKINKSIVDQINSLCQSWGLHCHSYELRNFSPPRAVLDAMSQQAIAERARRQAITLAEGDKQTAVIEAEGQKQARILKAEAQKIEKENQGQGEASVLLSIAESTALGLETIARSISTSPNAKEAISLKIAQDYIKAFEQLAKQSTTMLLPSNNSDPSAFIAQSLQMFKSIMSKNNSEISFNQENGVQFRNSSKSTNNDSTNVDNNNNNSEEFSNARKVLNDASYGIGNNSNSSPTGVPSMQPMSKKDLDDFFPNEPPHRSKNE